MAVVACELFIYLFINFRNSVLLFWNDCIDSVLFNTNLVSKTVVIKWMYEIFFKSSLSIKLNFTNT